ncbi:T9SS type A sorting domain-containing protein [Hymenobacter metallicola]|nr:T9SS type A sorting domain-containing protein [Hymenobacter metallicola]
MRYSWDVTTNKWAYPYKQEYSYDAAGRLTQETQRDSAFSSPSSRTLIAYNAQGLETSYINQFWNGNAWENGYRYLSMYDERGNQTESLSQEWKNGSWVTTDGSQTVYTYNAAGVITEAVYKDLENGNFVQEDRQLFTLTNGQWSSILYQVWDNGAWVTEERIVDIVWHDWAKQQPASYREQDFNGSSFVDNERNSITYSANGSTVDIEQEYTGTGWVNESRSSELKDNFGNDLGYTEEAWENNAWTLEYGSRNLLYYNANNAVVREVQQRYGSSGRWENDSRISYFDFLTITLANRNAALEAQSALYPNPASGVVTLEVAGLSKAEAASGEVRNALGQLVHSFSAQPQAGKLSTQLDLSNLKSGVYTVRLQTSEGAVVKRVVRN